MEWGVMNHIGSRNSRICFLACEEQSTRRWISEFQILIVVFNLKASATSKLIFPRECVDRLAVRLELLLGFAWPLLNSTVGPLPGIGFQDFSNSRRVQLCWPLTPKTQRHSDAASTASTSTVVWHHDQPVSLRKTAPAPLLVFQYHVTQVNSACH